MTIEQLIELLQKLGPLHKNKMIFFKNPDGSLVPLGQIGQVLAGYVELEPLFQQ